jgi:hypothetical protein
MPDWSERDVEDWVCRAPLEVWDGACAHVAVAGRQITLPSGSRLDVLLVVLDPDHVWRLVVVEIKVGFTDPTALVQLVRYVDELRQAFADSVRVSGVLLGSAHRDDVQVLVEMMPGVELATYVTRIKCYGAFDGGPDPSRPGWVHGVKRRDDDELAAFGVVYDVIDQAALEISDRRDRMLPVRTRALEATS